MPDIFLARNVLLIVIACCIFIAMGAILARRLTIGTLFKYLAITALVAIIGGVIFIATITFTSPENVETVKQSLVVIGIIVAACLLILCGGYFGKKTDIIRILIACGIVILVAVIIFLIYLAYLFFFTGTI